MYIMLLESSLHDTYIYLLEIGSIVVILLVSHSLIGTYVHMHICIIIYDYCF